MASKALIVVVKVMKTSSYSKHTKINRASLQGLLHFPSIDPSRGHVL